MTKIQLYTRDGGFVGDFEVPPFKGLPQVIILEGSRVFLFQGGTRYNECFFYAIPPIPDASHNRKKK